MGAVRMSVQTDEFFLGGGDFDVISLEELLLWIMDLYYIIITNKQLFTSQDVKIWTGVVDYCDVFISCLDSFWRHPFTAGDPNVISC